MVVEQQRAISLWVQFGYKIPISGSRSGKFEAVGKTLAQNIKPQKAHSGLPHPPERYVAQQYVLTETFFGRQEELALLR